MATRVPGLGGLLSPNGNIRTVGYVEDLLDPSKPKSYTTDMDTTFRSNLEKMLRDAPASVRNNVIITSGARSVSRQRQLFEAAVKKYGSERAARKWVAPPGRSAHNAGIAADLNFQTATARKWFHKNAADYGLHFPMSYEPWHIQAIKGPSGAPVYTKEEYKGIQQVLKAAGFDPGSPDGVWGPKSAKALEAFQKAKGLPADGIPGPQTIGALHGAKAMQPVGLGISRPNPQVRPAPFSFTGAPIGMVERRNLPPPASASTAPPVARPNVAGGLLGADVLPRTYGPAFPDMRARQIAADPNAPNWDTVRKMPLSAAAGPRIGGAFADIRGTMPTTADVSGWPVPKAVPTTPFTSYEMRPPALAGRFDPAPKYAASPRNVAASTVSPAAAARAASAITKANPATSPAKVARNVGVVPVRSAAASVPVNPKAATVASAAAKSVSNPVQSRQAIQQSANAAAARISGAFEVSPPSGPIPRSPATPVKAVRAGVVSAPTAARAVASSPAKTISPAAAARAASSVVASNPASNQAAKVVQNIAAKSPPNTKAAPVRRPTASTVTVAAARPVSPAMAARAASGTQTAAVGGQITPAKVGLGVSRPNPLDAALIKQTIAAHPTQALPQDRLAKAPPAVSRNPFDTGKTVVAGPAPKPVPPAATIQTAAFTPRTPQPRPATPAPTNPVDYGAPRTPQARPTLRGANPRPEPTAAQLPTRLPQARPFVENVPRPRPQAVQAFTSTYDPPAAVVPRAVTTTRISTPQVAPNYPPQGVFQAPARPSAAAGRIAGAFGDPRISAAQPQNPAQVTQIGVPGFTQVSARAPGAVPTPATTFAQRAQIPASAPIGLMPRQPTQPPAPSPLPTVQFTGNLPRARPAAPGGLPTVAAPTIPAAPVAPRVIPGAPAVPMGLPPVGLPSVAKPALQKIAQSVAPTLRAVRDAIGTPAALAGFAAATGGGGAFATIPGTRIGGGAVYKGPGQYTDARGNPVGLFGSSGASLAATLDAGRRSLAGSGLHPGLTSGGGLTSNNRSNGSTGGFGGGFGGGGTVSSIGGGGTNTGAVGAGGFNKQSRGL